MAGGKGHKVTSGMDVQSNSGEPIGAVVDIVLDPTGEPAYVVVATPTGSAAAVPYSTANSMVHNNKMVMDRSKLENAPKVQQSQLQDQSNTSWQGKSDKYWGSKGSMRSASPGKDSDSSSKKSSSDKDRG
jgi:uncharacterized protein YrrD